MLDFNKLIQQIEQIGRESLSDTDDERDILASAGQAFEDAVQQPDKLAGRLEDNRTTTFWPLAQLMEEFGSTHKVEGAPESVVVAAVDGSQIMPSHHEVHSCYLLNVGVAVIGYGDNAATVLESVPQLFHSPEDLYPLVEHRRVHIDELHISLERTLLELRILLERSIEARELDKEKRIVTLFDGSLISWQAEQLPPAHQQQYHERFVEILDGFHREHIPLVGYLSHSRASDVVNMLRVSVCPYEQSRCREMCGDLDEEEYPCSSIWPLSDRALFQSNLEVNHRSFVCLSGAKASNRLPPQHQICICYLNSGAEIARLEFPSWLYSNTEQFQLTLNTVLTQCHKGMGYPICLSEAHHLAVIKSADRDRFFDLVTRHLLALGVRNIRVSPKESKKRSGFV